MPYFLKSDVSGKNEEIAIFAILSPIDNSCFVWKVNVKRLKERYKYHYNENSPKTAELFRKAKQNNLVPPMYVLQTVNTSQEKAFLYCIAWAKYFEKHGYDSISGEGIDKYTKELREETKKIYESIKDFPLSDVCAEGSDLFPNYGRKKNVNADENDENMEEQKRTVTFQLPNEEWLSLKQIAKSNNLTLADYCRQSIVKGRVINVDLDLLSHFSKYYNEFSIRNNLLNQILWEIHRTGKYVPTDLEIIKEAVKDNQKQQEICFKKIDKLIKKLLK